MEYVTYDFGFMFMYSCVEILPFGVLHGNEYHFFDTQDIRKGVLTSRTRISGYLQYNNRFLMGKKIAWLSAGIRVHHWNLSNFSNSGRNANNAKCPLVGVLGKIKQIDETKEYGSNGFQKRELEQFKDGFSNVFVNF